MNKESLANVKKQSVLNYIVIVLQTETLVANFVIVETVIIKPKMMILFS